MKNTHLMTVIADDGHPWPLADDAGKTLGFAQRGEWPAAWVSITDAANTPLVAAYRLRFTAARAETVRIFVSADERYDLFLDGVRVSRGPERGDPLHWYYDTLELILTPGEHLLVARVWSLGIGLAPWSQLSLRHGLLLAAADLAWNAVLGTGVADWEGMRLPGYRFTAGNHVAWASDEHIDASVFQWDFEHGAGEGWHALRVNDRGRSACASSLVHTYEHALVPGRLPALLATVRQVGTVRQVDDPGTLDSAGIPYQQDMHLESEAKQWQHLVTDAQAITVPPHTRRRVLIDLDDYYNAYPQLSFSGGTGAEIRLGWAEGLYEGDNTQAPKGNRDIVAGKYFLGPHDTILPDGRADGCWQPLWWRAGRYLELHVATADSPLILHSLAIEETRYPYESDGAFSSDDVRLARLLPICERTVQNCAHESYMD
ncbi:MAG: alpha-L-rhamnosidase, partial [bacterium]